jgi:hypothetical protein
MQQVIWNCTSANAGKVNIKYSIDGGYSYPSSIADDVDNNFTAHTNRTQNWNVTDPITHNFRVMVEDTNSSRSGLNATSSSNSWIIAYFNVTRPTPNQTLVVNDSMLINWTSHGELATSANLNISTVNFTTNDNVTTILIDENANNTGFGAGKNSYPWTVPDMISQTVKVMVADANPSDMPYAYDDTENFTIIGKFNVTAPVDGNNFSIGYDTLVTWTTVGTIPKVNITAYNTLPVNYSDINFTRFNYTPENPLVIVTNYTNNGSFPWNVNDTATAYARLRICDYTYPEVWADSSGNFSIRGSFNLTIPGEADEYKVG